MGTRLLYTGSRLSSNQQTESIWATCSRKDIKNRARAWHPIENIEGRRAGTVNLAYVFYPYQKGAAFGCRGAK